VRGASLREILKREGRLSPGRAVALMLDICAGVGVAHRHGLVHRDLKPDNVIVAAPEVEGEPEVAKVVDFGIAKLGSSTSEFNLTQTGTTLGTPFYMSPEQWQGEQLDARSDVYSLGAMLYEMLAGTPPYPAASLPELIAKQISQEAPAFPSPLHIPPALEQTCRTALAKNPEERPLDANLFSRELQAALQTPASQSATLRLPHRQTFPGATDTARTLPLIQSERRSPGMKWVLAGSATLVLVIVVIGAILIARSSIFNSNRANPNRTSVTSQNNAAHDEQTTANNANSASDSVASSRLDLAGKWTGTYGPSNNPATLTISEYKDGKFSGVLEQGGTRVAFTATLDPQSRRVTMKETRVLNGSGWSLGENTGELSADGRSMSGTGNDATGRQFGMSYQWSFSR